MSIIISKRLQSMTYSKTLLMAKKARYLNSLGVDVINLSVGEPDFFPFPSILNAAKQAIDSGHHYYTPVSGYKDLRKAISLKFNRDNKLNYNIQQIVVSNGCKQAIINIFLSILNSTDEVIIPSPYWISYYEMVKLCNAKPVIVDTDIDNNFKITPKLLKKAITNKTKAFIFSSPCNPTGSIYTKQELFNLAQVLSQYPNILIISDEIYEHINYTNTCITSIASFDNVYNQTVTLNGLSKSFAMTGWRVGYIGAPLWLAKACEKIQGQTTSGINAIAQCAAIEALRILPSKLSNIIKILKKKRNLTFNLFSNIKGFNINKPLGAFYMFIEISFFIGKKFNDFVIHDADDLAMLILEKTHVVTVGGVSFGNSKYLRISYSVSEKNIYAAFDRINKFLKKIN